MTKKFARFGPWDASRKTADGPEENVGDFGVCVGDLNICVGDFGICVGNFRIFVGNLGVCIGNFGIFVDDLDVCVGNFGIFVGDLGICVGDFRFRMERRRRDSEKARKS